MSILEVATAYVNFAWETFQYDMHMYTHGWMYFLLLVPALVYSVFFIVKWAFITIPLWLPAYLICSALPRPKRIQEEEEQK